MHFQVLVTEIQVCIRCEIWGVLFHTKRYDNPGLPQAVLTFNPI